VRASPISESADGDPLIVATIRPFQVSKPLTVTSSAPHAPRRRRRVPMGTGENFAAASRYAAMRRESLWNAISTRPKSTRSRLPRCAAKNHVSTAGTNTISRATESASGDSAGDAGDVECGRAEADGATPVVPSPSVAAVVLLCPGDNRPEGVRNAAPRISGSSGSCKWHRGERRRARCRRTR